MLSTLLFYCKDRYVWAIRVLQYFSNIFHHLCSFSNKHLEQCDTLHITCLHQHCKTTCIKHCVLWYYYYRPMQYFQHFSFAHVPFFWFYIDWFSGARCWWLGCWLGTNPVSCQREGMEFVLIIIFRNLQLKRFKHLFFGQVLCWLPWYKSLLYSITERYSWPMGHSIHLLCFLVSFNHYFSATFRLLCCDNCIGVEWTCKVWTLNEGSSSSTINILQHK